MFRIAAFGSMVFFLSACVTSPAKLQLAADSPRGAIAFVGGPTPIPYTLNIVSFDAERQALTVSPLGGWASIEAQRAPLPVVWLTDAKPGRYVLKDVTRQRAWAVCFHEASVSFEVKPGEVTVLGQFDPIPHLKQIEVDALASGRMMARSSTLHHFFDNVSPPTLTAAQEADLEFVQRHLAEEAPGISAPLRPAALEPASFGTGWHAFGLYRVCGGYYRDDAESE